MTHRQRLKKIGAALTFVLASASQAAPNEVAHTVVYRSSSGQTLKVTYEAAGERVRVHWPARRVNVLTRAMSGSGARYTGGPLELWEHHGEISLRNKDKLMFQGAVP